MSRLIAVYVVAGLCLFGALFAAIALSGLAKPREIEPQPGLAQPEVAEAPPAAPPPDAFVPPTLEPGRQYQLSHATPVYPAPGAPGGDSGTLPANGVFTAIQTVNGPLGHWTEISFESERGEQVAYLNGMDLRWKVLSPAYSADEQRIARRENANAMMGNFRETVLKRRQREVAPPPPPEPEGIREWWSASAENLGGPAVANLLASGLAAGLTTLLLLGAIAVLSTFQRQSAWARPDLETGGEGNPGEEDYFAHLRAEDETADDDPDRPRE